MLKKIMGSLVIFLFFLWGGVWLFSPALVRWVSGDLLQPYGLVIKEDSVVRANIFSLKVTVSDLAFLQQDETTLALDELVVNLAFWPLLNKRVEVEELTMRGLNTSVRKTEDEASVAGFSLLQSSSENAISDQSDPDVSSERAAFQVVLPTLQLQDSTVVFYYDDTENILQLSDFTLTNVNMHEGAIALQMVLEAELNNATLELQSALQSEDGQLNVTSRLKLSGLDLRDVRSLLPDAPYFAGFIDVAVDSETSINAQESHIVIKDGTVNLSNLVFEDSQFSASGNSIELGLENLELDLTQATLNHMLAEVQLSAEQVVVNLLEGDSTIASLGSLTVTQLAASYENDNAGFSVAEVSIRDLLVSQVQPSQSQASDSVAPSPLLLLEELSFTELEGDQQGIQVGEILLYQPEVAIDITAEGGIANLLSLSDASEPEPTELESTQTTDAITLEGQQSEDVGYSVDVSQLRVVDNGLLHLTDSSVSPAFDKVIEIEQFDIADFSITNNQQPMTFVLKAHDGEFFTIAAEGSGLLFGELLDLELEGSVNELSLPQVSPYTSEYIGFGIDKGQMNLELAVNVVDSIIDGDVVIYLNGAEFGSSGSSDTISLLNQGSISLNLALNMLKDGDGNIKLTVPMSGDIDDPSFGLQYIVGLIMQKAALNQARSYLLNAFVPYAKVVSVAVTAGEYALQVRFEDLAYSPGEVEVSLEQEEYVQQLVNLMQDNEAMVVHLCPVATPLEPVIVEASPESESSTEERQMQALLALATERANNFKRYVVEQGGVESGRLLICSAEIDDKEGALPHLSLSVQ